MPLHADNEVRSRVELDGFNDAIDRGDRSDEQVVAGDSDGLMMARIDLWDGSLGGRNQPGESRTGSYPSRMRIGNSAPRLMIHFGLDVLDQGPVAPDVERLGAVTDGKNGLLEVEGVLQQELIHGGTGGVGFATLGDWVFAKSLRVNIEAAARKQHPLNTEKQPGDAVRSFVQRNNNGGYTGRVKGGKIGG